PHARHAARGVGGVAKRDPVGEGDLRSRDELVVSAGRGTRETHERAGRRPTRSSDTPGVGPGVQAWSRIAVDRVAGEIRGEAEGAETGRGGRSAPGSSDTPGVGPGVQAWSRIAVDRVAGEIRVEAERAETGRRF